MATALSKPKIPKMTKFSFYHMTFQLSNDLPAAAICSLVRIGWKPTNGTCIDKMSPII